MYCGGNEHSTTILAKLFCVNMRNYIVSKLLQVGDNGVVDSPEFNFKLVKKIFHNFVYLNS